MRTYSEAILLPTFEERFEYLKLSGVVGAETFGVDRMLNQALYRSPEWKRFRNEVIARDGGCDLADPDRPIQTAIYIHHINPITIQDVLDRSPRLFDLENSICTSFSTHQAIHYGDQNQLVPTTPLERKPNDQAPWRKEG